MYEWICAAALAALSAAVMLSAAAYANRRGNRDGFALGQGMYRWNTRTAAVYLLCVLAAGTAGYAAARTANSPLSLLKLGIGWLALLAAAVVDAKLHIIPNFLPVGMAAARLLYFVYEWFFRADALGYLVSSLIGCFLCAVVLLAGNRLSKGGIGSGDIKLLASLGFLCGLSVVMSAMILALIACLAAAGVLFLMERNKGKDPLPFAPFILAGYLAMILLGIY